jgi:hypothetical protein
MATFALFSGRPLKCHETSVTTARSSLARELSCPPDTLMLLADHHVVTDIRAPLKGRVIVFPTQSLPFSPAPPPAPPCQAPRVPPTARAPPVAALPRCAIRAPADLPFRISQLRSVLPGLNDVQAADILAQNRFDILMAFKYYSPLEDPPR